MSLVPKLVQVTVPEGVSPTGFRIWVSLIVTKLYSLLMKIGEHRAKEVDDHHNYDAKCACMP